ncbi:MAG: hypothetical protein ACR2HJ_05725 [Fimbriimonadales bacterium]
MRLGLLRAVGVIAAGVAITHESQDQASGPKTGLLCTLANHKVDESSGVAASRRRAGLYWTHNDSGDGPNFYAFDRKGRDLGTFTLKGVRAIDWEGMASARIAGRPYLYFGDIGDNAERRKSVLVYRVPEPRARPGMHQIDGFRTFTLRYPDGAHDCETLMVTPQGDIQLVTKSEYGASGIYRMLRPEKSGTYRLVKLGEMKVDASNVYSHMITGGDINAAGNRVIIRTYFTAMAFRTGNLDRWFRSKPVDVDIAFERQGEAICFDGSAAGLITTSERSPCRASFARLP